MAFSEIITRLTVLANIPPRQQSVFAAEIRQACEDPLFGMMGSKERHQYKARSLAMTAAIKRNLELVTALRAELSNFDDELSDHFQMAEGLLQGILDKDFSKFCKRPSPALWDSDLSRLQKQLEATMKYAGLPKKPKHRPRTSPWVYHEEAFVAKLCTIANTCGGKLKPNKNEVGKLGETLLLLEKFLPFNIPSSARALDRIVRYVENK